MRLCCVARAAPSVCVPVPGLGCGRAGGMFPGPGCDRAGSSSLTGTRKHGNCSARCRGAGCRRESSLGALPLRAAQKRFKGWEDSELLAGELRAFGFIMSHASGCVSGAASPRRSTIALCRTAGCATGPSVLWIKPCCVLPCFLCCCCFSLRLQCGSVHFVPWALYLWKAKWRQRYRGNRRVI